MAEFAWSGWALSFQAAHAKDNESEGNERELRRHDEADPFEDQRRPDNRKKVLELKWPLFPTPTLSSIQVSGYEMYNNSLYYAVSIEMVGGFKWSVLKSYDEFAILHKILVECYHIDKTLFPHRKVFGSHKLDNIKDMMTRLNAYLTTTLKYFLIPPPQMLQFLEYRFSDILSITQTLSSLFYDRGEEFIETGSMVAFSPLQLHCICQRLVLPIDSDPHSVKEDFGHLLDFLQQLKKIKVCHPKRKAFKLAADVKPKFDLSIMKTLDTLVIQKINIDLIEGLGNLPQCLTILAAHSGLNAIRDIIKHTSLIPEPNNEYVHWSSLKIIDFSGNQITTIDSSLELALNLEDLNLSNNLIKDIDNLSNLPHLRIVDLSNNKVESLMELHRRLGNITTLCLSNNVLHSLQGLEKCYSIVCLDIQHNKLMKVSDIAPLSSLPLLEQLMIKGNPFIDKVPFYRQKVFDQLYSTASQLSVDGKPPSRDELELALKESKKKAEKTKKLKKVTVREVSIKGDEEEPLLAIADVNSNREEGTRRNMEDMRKEGGENWLTLLNQQQPQASPVAIHKKRKHKKGSKKKHKIHINVASNSSGDMESSTEYPRKHPFGSSTGLPSPHLIQLLGTRQCSSTPWSCTVSVTECKEDLPKLTHPEMDDLLMTAAMEACVVIIDISLGRITEDYIITETKGKNRNTRDLTFLRSVRVHEGHVLAISIELSTIVTNSSWVVYSVKDYPSLADMYLLLSRKLKSVDDIVLPSPVMLSKQLSVPQSDDFDTEPEEGTPREEQTHEEVALRIEQTHEEETIKEEQTNQVSDEENKKIRGDTTITSTDRPVSLLVGSFTGPVKKPGLESVDFQKFFMKKVVRDSSEVLLYVQWCGLCLPSTAPLQVEGAVAISNDCVYLLEVKGYQQWKWDGNNPPLFPLASFKLEHMSRITVSGMFNHNLYIEVHQGMPLTSFVIFSFNSEQCHQLVKQLQASLDASSLDYKVMDALEVKKMKKTSGIVFVSPDHYSGNRLKEWLSQDRNNVRLANFISTQMDKKAVGMYEVELQQSCKEAARSFDIEQYLVVMSIDQSDNCKLHTLVLVVTNTEMYLYEEAFISGPGLRFTPVKYAFPPVSIVQQEKISSIKSISFCTTPQYVHSPSDPIYQVAIDFKEGFSVPWYFCTRDVVSLRQTFNYIEQQWNTLLSNEESLCLINSSSSSLPYFVNLPSEIPSRLSKKEHSHKSSVPFLIKTRQLLLFQSLPNWKKIEKFNDHISQANYLKHDETVVTSALVYCVPSSESKKEMEVSLIISNYAIYLVSDIDGIRQWLDAGGISSFSRMSLLNPDTEYPLQCFYRMWLSDLRKIEVNHLSLSICLYEVRPKISVQILTCSEQLTASILLALACKINIVDNKQDEKKGPILLDFVDIADDPFGEEDTEDFESSPASPSSVRPSVEFSVTNEQDLMKLKLHLVESQPDVARGSSIHKCSESMRIMCSQIMLIPEHLRVRDTILPHYRPQLVLLTNYGVFVCSNASLPNNTPCLCLNMPSLNIKVKKWYRINDVLSVQASTESVYSVPQITLAVKQATDDAPTELCLYPLSCTQGYVFVHQLSLIWAERSGRTLHTEYV